MQTFLHVHRILAGEVYLRFKFVFNFLEKFSFKAKFLFKYLKDNLKMELRCNQVKSH